MFGIPHGGPMRIYPSNIFCDNEGVILNTTHPESIIKRKHTPIAYHQCHGTQAASFPLEKI
jgi:hypothetical protein